MSGAELYVKTKTKRHEGRRKSNLFWEISDSDGGVGGVSGGGGVGARRTVRSINGEVSGSEAEDGKERAGIDMLKNSFSNALSRDRHTHRSRSYSMPGEFIYRKKRISV